MDGPAAVVQNMISNNSTEEDASGNAILGDIGLYLAKSLKRHFKEAGRPIDLKYIDPTYMIRAISTIPSDRVYCNVLGQNSVHAAFAGFSGAQCPLATPAIGRLLVGSIDGRHRLLVMYMRLGSKPGLASMQLLLLVAKGQWLVPHFVLCCTRTGLRCHPQAVTGALLASDEAPVVISLAARHPSPVFTGGASSTSGCYVNA